MAATVQPAARVPEGLGERLLDELRRSRLAAPAELQDAAQKPEELSVARFVALYRDAIEQLEAQVAQGDRHPPMRKQEVDLMCRCLLSCRTLAEAVDCAADFCVMLHPRAGALRLERRGERAVFHMDTLRLRRSSAACLVDLTGLFCYLQLFGWLIGAAMRPEQVFLAHPRREDAMPFLGLFGAPVEMGQPTSGFSFAAALLERPVLRQPHELEAFLVDFPFRLVGGPAVELSLSQQVQGFVDAALARALPPPSLGRLAAGFGLSVATLRRRLHSEGASYQSLREQCLREAADHYLRDTDWSIERIAERLGFSGGVAFRRAVRRWTGRSPSARRREL